VHRAQPYWSTTTVVADDDYAAQDMNVPTASRRPEAPSEKRQAIEAAVLRAMEELLAEGATYGTLSVERIATRAGISRTAFYFYFRDKRELLMRLATELSDELYREADAWWSGAGDGPEQLTAALNKIAGVYGVHAPLVCAIVEVSAYDEVVAPFWHAIIGRFVDASAQRIAAEIAARRASPALVPEATAFALVWMTERALYQMLVRGAPVSRDAIVQALGDIWIATVYAEE
jgi:TetR/AcrR family transcriptional regulator, ethionamide resistance regulator